MVLRIKAIKAQRMNIKAQEKALLEALIAEGTDIRRDMEQTTATWSGAKPTFKPRVSTSGGAARVEVEPKGNPEGVKKWRILDEGAVPHVITPRRARRLRFKAQGFQTKAKPGKLKSGRGRAASGPDVYARRVRHPGITKRGWSSLLQRQSSLRFVKRINRAMQIGANRMYG